MSGTKVETEAKKYVSVPDVSNLEREDAAKVLQVAGLDYEIKGDKSYIGSQTPAAFSQVEVGTKIILTAAGEIGVDEVIVPDLTGKLLREVAEITNAMGLKVKTTGSGVVFEQTPIPGTRVRRGDVIDVKFKTVEEDIVEETDIVDELAD